MEVERDIVFWIALCLLSVGCLGQCRAENQASTASDVSDTTGGNETVDATDTGAEEVADAEDNSPKVRVATYNARRLFDDNCDSDECGEYEAVPSTSEYEARLDKIAEGLAKIDADVIVLQEVEKKVVLEDINGKLADSYPVIVFGETGEPASLDVGIMARGRLLDSGRYRGRGIERPDGTTTVFTRELLRADLEIRNDNLSIFGAHFKSQSGDDLGQRIAEAEAARNLIEEFSRDHSSRLILLAGDLNDKLGSRPLDKLLLNDGLRWIGAGESLWTYRYRNETQLIDYILWEPTEDGEYLDNTVRTYRDDRFSGFVGSDHSALSGDFKL